MAPRSSRGKTNKAKADKKKKEEKGKKILLLFRLYVFLTHLISLNSNLLIN